LDLFKSDGPLGTDSPLSAFLSPFPMAIHIQAKLPSSFTSPIGFTAGWFGCLFVGLCCLVWVYSFLGVFWGVVWVFGGVLVGVGLRVWRVFWFWWGIRRTSSFPMRISPKDPIPFPWKADYGPSLLIVRRKHRDQLVRTIQLTANLTSFRVNMVFPSSCGSLANTRGAFFFLSSFPARKGALFIRESVTPILRSLCRRPLIYPFLLFPPATFTLSKPLRERLFVMMSRFSPSFSFLVACCFLSHRPPFDPEME